MKSAFVFLLAMGLVGCAKSAPPKPGHWKHTVKYVETYDRCLDSDGRELVEIMHRTPHGENDDTDTYDEFENGAGYGNYETLQQAKAFAIKRNPECGGPQ